MAKAAEGTIRECDVERKDADVHTDALPPMMMKDRRKPR
jgi:hypothetical protein